MMSGRRVELRWRVVPAALALPYLALFLISVIGSFATTGVIRLVSSFLLLILSVGVLLSPFHLQHSTEGTRNQTS